jgi:hypothetical protein
MNTGRSMTSENTGVITGGGGHGLAHPVYIAYLGGEHPHHFQVPGMLPATLPRQLLCVILVVCAAVSPASSEGTVYLVLGSDTATWEGMDVSRYNCTYALSLYTDPLRNAARIMDPAFRAGLLDSYGTPVRLTWWMMAGNIFRHATNTNIPRPNTMTLHLMKKHQGKAVTFWGDELSLHYHTFVWTDYDGDGKWYWNQAREFAGTADDFDVTLAEMLLEEECFPVSFRSGWHAMDNAWQQRLDTLLLYSMHNDWPAKRSDPTEPIDNEYDWSRSPSAFVPFHPSPVDYQVPGAGRGWNVRSEYMASADSAFMTKIFAQAAAGTDQVVCLWAHLPETDFLDNVLKVHTSSVKAASRYPGVKFRYCSAVEAMQRWLRTADTTRPAVTLEEISGTEPVRWRFTSSEPTFQPSPFFAAKNRYDEYLILPVAKVAPQTWETTAGVPLAEVAKVGVALTDTAGNMTIAVHRYLPDELFVDDVDPGFSIVSGSWTSTTTTGWGASSHISSSGSSEQVGVRWTPAIPSDGLYAISVRVPGLAAPAQQTLFKILQGGTVLDTMLFTRPLTPEGWIHLATRHFTAGTSTSIEMSSPGVPATGTRMAADVLRVSSLVRDRWLVSPDQISAGELVEDEPAVRRMSLRNDGLLPCSILSAGTARGLVSVATSLPVIVQGMDSASIALNLVTAQLGAFIDTLLLTTDDPRHALLRIPVSGLVSPYFKIVDDEDSAGYTETGDWRTSVAQAYGTRSRYAYPAAGVSATYAAQVRKGGRYDVQILVPTTVNASTRARYLLSVDGVPGDTLYTDQNEGSGTWKLLVSRNLSAYAQLTLLLTDAMSPVVSGKVLRADAIRFQWSADPTHAAESGALPEQFMLGQNYPNPFNPSTTLTYDVAAEGTVDLSVFDLLGRHITTLVSGHVQPGRYTVIWDAHSVATGVYFARISVVNQQGSSLFTAARSLLLSK